MQKKTSASQIAPAPATASGAPNVSAEMIEDAMTQATIQAAVEGITDPAVILSRKMAARAAITGE